MGKCKKIKMTIDVKEEIVGKLERLYWEWNELTVKFNYEERKIKNKIRGLEEELNL